MLAWHAFTTTALQKKISFDYTADPEKGINVVNIVYHTFLQKERKCCDSIASYICLATHYWALHHRASPDSDWVYCDVGVSTLVLQEREGVMFRLLPIQTNKN